MLQNFTFELNKFGFMQKRLKRENKTLVPPNDPETQIIQAEIVNADNQFR